MIDFSKSNRIDLSTPSRFESLKGKGLDFSEPPTSYAPISTSEAGTSTTTQTTTGAYSPTSWLKESGNQFRYIQNKIANVPEYDMTNQLDKIKAIWRVSDLEMEKNIQRSYQLDGKDNIYDEVSAKVKELQEKYPELKDVKGMQTETKAEPKL